MPFFLKRSLFFGTAGFVAGIPIVVYIDMLLPSNLVYLLLIPSFVFPFVLSVLLKNWLSLCTPGGGVVIAVSSLPLVCVCASIIGLPATFIEFIKGFVGFLFFAILFFGLYIILFGLLIGYLSKRVFQSAP